MKRLFMLSLAISMAAASISAAERQVSPRFGEGMPSSRKDTKYDEMAAVYGRRPNKRVSVERPSMILSPEYMQKKEVAQARRAEQFAARRAQMLADREIALANRDAALAERRRANAMAEERASRIEALSRAYEGYEVPVQDLRAERLAGYTGLELKPDALPKMGSVGREIGSGTGYGTKWGRELQGWWNTPKGQHRFRGAEFEQPNDLVNFVGYERTPRVRTFENQPRMLPEPKDVNDHRYWSDPSLKRYNPNIRELVEAEGSEYREGQRTYPEYFREKWNEGRDFATKPFGWAYSKMPSRETLGSYVPSWESVKGTPSSMWSGIKSTGSGLYNKLPSLRTSTSAENVSLSAESVPASGNSYMPSWESVKGTPSSMWSGAKAAGYGLYNRIPSFKSEPTSADVLRENAIQAQTTNGGWFNKASQYIPGTPAYKQRMENEARDKQARKKLQETRQQIIDLQRQMGM